MPLVIPDMNQEGTATGTTTGDKAEEWQNKLVGKTLHDEESNETTFSKKDLPEEHRIITPTTRVTRDFRMNRINVHVGDDGIVTHVTAG